MPATIIGTCPLCWLRFGNRPLLELHLREDHLSEQDQRADTPVPADRTSRQPGDHPESRAAAN